MEILEKMIVRLHVFLNLELEGDEKSAEWPFALPQGVEHQEPLGRRLCGSIPVLVKIIVNFMFQTLFR